MKDYPMEIDTQKGHIFSVTTAEDEKTARRQIGSDLNDLDLYQLAQTKTLTDISLKLWDIQAFDTQCEL